LRERYETSRQRRTPMSEHSSRGSAARKLSGRAAVVVAHDFGASRSFVPWARVRRACRASHPCRV